MSKKPDKKRNSTKHGAYSRELMLPGERRVDFEKLRRAHYDELAPEGINEESVVDALIELHWKRRRLTQYDQARLRQRNEQVRLDNEVLDDTCFLRDLGPCFSDAADAEAAEQILAQLKPDYQWAIKQWVPREKCLDPAKWHQDVGKFLSCIKTEEPMEDPDLFATIVDPDLMEQEIARLSRLDEAIDRMIKRLMQLKTGKQVFPSMRKDKRPEPKLINPPTGAPTRRPPAISKNETIQSEIVLCTEESQEKSAVPPQDDVVVEETPIDDSRSMPASSNQIKKEHSDKVHGKVDFFAERPSPEQLNKFSTFCTKTSSVSSNSGPSYGLYEVATAPLSG
jgi:hypothetical protein